jgi:hypothetical protein
VINLVHQGQQTTQFGLGKTLARKPVEVVARQIGNQAPMVFSERHGAGDKQLQVLGVHARLSPNLSGLKGHGFANDCLRSLCHNDHQINRAPGI